MRMTFDPWPWHARGALQIMPPAGAGVDRGRRRRADGAGRQRSRHHHRRRQPVASHVRSMRNRRTTRPTAPPRHLRQALGVVALAALVGFGLGAELEEFARNAGWVWLAANARWIAAGTLAVVALAGWLLHGALQRQRLAHRLAFATQLGMTMGHEVPTGVRGHIAGQFRPERATVSDIMVTAAADAALAIAEVRLGGADDDADKKKSAQTVAFVEREGLDLPRFSLRPRTLIERLLVGVTGLPTVEVDAHPEFAQRYHVFGHDAARIRALLSPAVLDSFASRPGLELRGERDRLVLFEPGKRQSGAELEPFVREAIAVCRVVVEAGRALPASMPTSVGRPEAPGASLLPDLIDAGARDELAAFLAAPAPRAIPRRLRATVESNGYLIALVASAWLLAIAGLGLLGATPWVRSALATAGFAALLGAAWHSRRRLRPLRHHAIVAGRVHTVEARPRDPGRPNVFVAVADGASERLVAVPADLATATHALEHLSRDEPVHVLLDGARRRGIVPELLLARRPTRLPVAAVALITTGLTILLALFIASATSGEVIAQRRLGDLAVRAGQPPRGRTFELRLELDTAMSPVAIDLLSPDGADLEHVVVQVEDPTGAGLPTQECGTYVIPGLAVHTRTFDVTATGPHRLFGVRQSARDHVELRVRAGHVPVSMLVAVTGVGLVFVGILAAMGAMLGQASRKTSVAADFKRAHAYAGHPRSAASSIAAP